MEWKYIYLILLFVAVLVSLISGTIARRLDAKKKEESGDQCLEAKKY